MTKLHHEMIDKFSVLITGALGLVAALAWNSAIQKWFESHPLLAAGGPWLYAFVVTLIAVLATLWIGWLASKVKPKEEKT
jgi:hypothetical protein